MTPYIILGEATLPDVTFEPQKPDRSAELCAWTGPKDVLWVAR
jgi:hypothetical protein